MTKKVTTGFYYAEMIHHNAVYVFQGYEKPIQVLEFIRGSDNFRDSYLSHSQFEYVVTNNPDIIIKISDL